MYEYYKIENIEGVAYHFTSTKTGKEYTVLFRYFHTTSDRKVVYSMIVTYKNFLINEELNTMINDAISITNSEWVILADFCKTYEPFKVVIGHSLKDGEAGEILGKRAKLFRRNMKTINGYETKVDETNQNVTNIIKK